MLWLVSRPSPDSRCMDTALGKGDCLGQKEVLLCKNPSLRGDHCSAGLPLVHVHGPQSRMLELALGTPSPVHDLSPLSALGRCRNRALQEASDGSLRWVLHACVSKRAAWEGGSDLCCGEHAWKAAS